MSESDSWISALAGALKAVCEHIGFGSALDLSFYRWMAVNTPNSVFWDSDPEDAPKEVLTAAAEFVEAVDSAELILNAIPASMIEHLRAVTDGVRWDMRTRGTLKAIQEEISYFRFHSEKPEILLAMLRAMGKDGFERMNSKLWGFRLELTERLLDLNSLPDKILKLDGIAALPAIPKTKESYKWKDQLAEDHWIYENIHANSFDDLKVKHNEQCQSKKNFKKVLSRRAYWARGDRYADYHGLPKRRFKGACVCSDCQAVTDTPLTTD
jgi:hypothetical protein